MKYLVNLALLIVLQSLSSCRATPPSRTDEGQARRPIVTPFQEIGDICATLSEYTMRRQNQTYVDVDFGCTPNSSNSCGDAYFAANKAEQALCNAHAHYQIATSFDTRVVANIPTTEERLLSLRSSLYFLRRSLYYIDKGYSRYPLTYANVQYERYLAEELAEAAALADMFAMDGADLATGIGDSLGRSYGSFPELQRHVWGSLNSDGTVGDPGARGAAYSFLYGLPWRDLDDQLSENTDAWPATLPLCEVDAMSGAVARAVDVLTRTGVPVTLTTESFQLASDYQPGTERRVVPWTRAGDAGYGRRCLEQRYAGERPGVAPVPFDEILVTHRTSEAAMLQAAQALVERTRTKLIDMRMESADDCDYLVGFSGVSEDLQTPLLRSRGGLYVSAGMDVDQHLPDERAGLESLYAEIYRIAHCVAGENGDEKSFSCRSKAAVPADWPSDANLPGNYVDADTQAAIRRTLESVTGRVGRRYIDYTQVFYKTDVSTDYYREDQVLGMNGLWGRNVALYKPSGNDSVGVGIYFHNFHPLDLSPYPSEYRRRVRVFAVDAERDILRGVENEVYNLLSCLRFGQSVTGSACDLSQWEWNYGSRYCHFGRSVYWGSNACFMYLPWYRTHEECHWERQCSGNPIFPICRMVRVCHTVKEHLPPKLYVVTMYDPQTQRFDVLDTYLEKRPSDAGLYFDEYGVSYDHYRIYTRHFVDERTIAQKAQEITERDPRSCSLPRYNALGLANDSPVPLENELISSLQSGGPYEDSFAYFLTKAKTAAEAAGQSVAEALDSSTNLGVAGQHIENLRQDALDRVEQICGTGSDGCSAPRADYKLRNLNVLPLANAPAQCSTLDIPSYLANDDAQEMAAALEENVRCQAAWMFTNLGEVSIFGLPVFIGNALQWGSATTSHYDLYDGEYKIALLAVDTAVTDLRSAAAQARHELDSLGTAIASFEAQDGALEADVKAALMDVIASELDAMAELGRCSATNVLCGAGAAAHLLRAFAAAFRSAAAQLRQLAQRFSFIGQMGDSAHRIEQAMLSVAKAIDAMKSGIEKLDSLELEQTQVAAKAERMSGEYLTGYLGSGSLNQMKDFRLMTLRKHMAARRAIKRAQKMAFIARRAVEMKLAVNLKREKQPGVIGDPPSQWEGDLFTMFIADNIYNSGSSQSVAADYVTRLEDYVYGYPFQYPFADGEDSAVISLRDDLSRYEESCFEAVGERNWLPYSSQLEGWTVADVAGSVTVLPDTAYGPGDTEEPTADTLEAQITGCGNPTQCLVMESPSVTVTSQPPRGYVGSLYLRSDDVAPMRLVLLASYRGIDDHVQRRSSVASSDCAVSGQWQRCVVTQPSLAGPATGEYLRLSLRLSPMLTQYSQDHQLSLDVHGAQIEICPISDNDNPTCVASEYEPTPVSTGICSTVTVADPYTGLARVITYTNPQVKSQKMRDSFKVKCVQDAFALEGQLPGACAGRGGVEYFERPFSITLNDIEAGNILGQGQIGQGNYNYRISELAVNLVGSNIKDCSLDPGAGTSCYENLFVPYDFKQDGEVWLRDHSGNDLPMRLAVGTIHQGKAIAAERVLTSPLSSTDFSVVQQYLKQEFRGRPIQGNYTLRVYGTPSLRWQNIEDIQIYLKYRYWSPFSNP